MKSPDDYDDDDDDATRDRDRDDDRSSRRKSHRKMIRKFREQMHALGALWILFGVIAGGVGAAGLSAEDASREVRILFFLFIGLGAAWLVLGILTCLKQMWAVYIGLALTYVSLVGNAISLRVCAIIIAIVIILQAHRVISWAGQMKAKGIPLDAKPDE